MSWAKVFAVIAVAYNPFFRLEIEREWWMWLNGITILFVVFTGMLSSDSSTREKTGAEQDVPAKSDRSGG